MNSKKVAAIKKTLEVARAIQLQNPEIGDHYVAGQSLRTIKQYLSEQGYTHPYLCQSAFYAINGHEGILGTNPLLGLIKDQSLLETLAKQHKHDCGKRLVTEKLGIYQLTPSQKLEHARAGGKAIAEKIRSGEAKVGSAALSLEDRTRIAKAGVAGRGQTPWADLKSDATTLTPDEYARKLTQDPEFRFQTGGNRGDIRWAAIAQELSRMYNYRFTRHSVYSKLRKTDTFYPQIDSHDHEQTRFSN